MKKIEKRLDDIVRKILRLKYNSCYTCGSNHNLQVGHLFKRRHRGTRWELLVLRLQCEKCNCYNNGEDELYEEKLKKEIGVKQFDEMKFKSNQNTKYFKCDLLDIEKELSNVLKLLEN